MVLKLTFLAFLGSFLLCISGSKGFQEPQTSECDINTNIEAVVDEHRPTYWYAGGYQDFNMLSTCSIISLTIMALGGLAIAVCLSQNLCFGLTTMCDGMGFSKISDKKGTCKDPLSRVSSTMDATPVTVLVKSSAPLVPFVTFRQPKWKLLDKLLQAYKSECHSTLEKLSQSLEMAVLLEQQHISQGNHYQTNKNRRRFSIAKQIEERIQRLSSIYEEQERILQEFLLRPFDSIMALPSVETEQDDGLPHDSVSQQQHETISMMSTMKENSLVRSRTGMAHINATNLMSESAEENGNQTDTGINNIDAATTTTNSSTANAPASYDSALQVLAHLVRDWSDWGAPVRENLYDWCRQALRDYYDSCNKNDGNINDKLGDDNHGQKQEHLSILVPGAGMGRLAFDLATLDGHRVQALEVSLGMAAAASFLFNSSPPSSKTSSPTFTLYPYAHDGFQNQVHSADRYTGVKVPDVTNHTMALQKAFLESGASLSYSVAAFEDLLRVPPSPHRWNRGGGGFFDAVVTCFFIDTATNIWQYLDIVDHVLARKSDAEKSSGGGLWINVGPLQWHSNALLPTLAADELRLLLEDRNYEILHWSVDEKPMEYRNPSTNNGGRSSTAFNGYCPLRFVVRKKA